MVLTNPKYIHIADFTSVEISISTERFFDAKQTAIRGVRYLDFQYAPAAGSTLLKGIA